MRRQKLARLATNFPPQGREERVQSRENHLHIRMFLAPRADLLEMAPRRPAAVVAQAEEATDGGQIALPGRFEVGVEALDHLLAFAAVPPDRRAVRQDPRP